MKKLILFFILFLNLWLYYSCTAQTAKEKQNLSAIEFSTLIEEMPDALIMDVRTPAEYEKGHIENAQNITWNTADFENTIQTLDKSQAILVYCLSGGRSSAAARLLRSQGFEQVYELQGGMMQWRSQNLPEVMGAEAKADLGMKKSDFDSILSSADKLLVDFYADWCAPCQKMKVYLEEMAMDTTLGVTIIRIDADANPELCKELKVEGLPVLQLYEAGNLIWENKGYIGKEAVLEKLQ